MNGAPVAVRVVAAIGLGLLAAALVYAVTSGRLFVFPFLLLLGMPMVSALRPRRPHRHDALPPPPSRMSSN